MIRRGTWLASGPTPTRIFDFARVQLVNPPATVSGVVTTDGVLVPSKNAPCVVMVPPTFWCHAISPVGLTVRLSSVPTKAAPTRCTPTLGWASVICTLVPVRMAATMAPFDMVAHGEPPSEGVTSVPPAPAACVLTGDVLGMA